MTDPSPLTAEQIAELRKLLKEAALGTLEHVPWHVAGGPSQVRDKTAGWLLCEFLNDAYAALIVAAVNALPALLALAERPSSGECEAAILIVEQILTSHDGVYSALNMVEQDSLRLIQTLLRKLSAGESGGWQPTHRHYKGGLYRVIARGRIEADLTPCVVYDNAKGETWVRPAADFDEWLTNETPSSFPRFAPLPEPPK